MTVMMNFWKCTIIMWTFSLFSPLVPNSSSVDVVVVLLMMPPSTIYRVDVRNLRFEIFGALGRKDRSSKARSLVVQMAISPKTRSPKARSLDGQKSKCPEDRMTRSPEGQRSGWSIVWMFRWPEVQITSRSII